MKRVLILSVFAFLSVGSIVDAQVWVPGYTRRDGTYVPPHQRTRPNSRIDNNHDYPGNYNPNRGIITPGDPYRRDRDRDGVPDALDPSPYG